MARKKFRDLSQKLFGQVMQIGDSGCSPGSCSTARGSTGRLPASMRAVQRDKDTPYREIKQREASHFISISQPALVEFWDPDRNVRKGAKTLY